MGALENNAPNTFIGGSGEDYPDAASFVAATGIPEVSIKNYQVDAYNNISCRIDLDYDLSASAFSNYLGAGKKLRDYFIDSEGRIKNTGGRSLAQQPNLKLLFPGLTHWGSQTNGFNQPGPYFLYAPELVAPVDVSGYVFHDWRNGMGRIYIPKFKTPVGYANNLLFTNYQLNNDASKKNVLYIHPDMATNAKIVAIQTKSGVKADVRVVDDLTVPSSITDLAIVEKSATKVKLSFTPATGINTVDFYEIWFEELDNFLPENRFFPQLQELTASGQVVIGLKPDTDYRLRLATVDTKYNGTGMSKTPAFSNELIFKTNAGVGTITDLAVSGNYNLELILSFTPVFGADSYDVYVDGVLYTNISGSGDSISGLTPDETYDIKIKAVEGAYEGEFSNEIEVTIGEDSIAELPVALWELHTNSLDSSGNGNNGTDTGMSYVGGIANFNGGYIDVADSDDLSFTDGTDDLSFGMAFSFIWDDKSGTQFIINKRNDANGPPREWQIDAHGTDLYLIFSTEDGTAQIRIEIPVSSITTGVENTLYLYYDGSKAHTGISAFLNGNNPIGTTSLIGTYTGQGNSNAPVRIGMNTWNTNNPFKGKMKNMYLWKDKPPITGNDIDELDYRLKNDIPL